MRVSVSLSKLSLHSSHSVLPRFHVSQVGSWQARQGRAGQGRAEQGRAGWLAGCFLLYHLPMTSQNDQSKCPVKLLLQ